MDDEKINDTPLPKAAESETSGQYLQRKIGIVGCCAVLLFFVLFLITCFTAGAVA